MASCKEKLEQNRQKTKLNDAVVCGMAKMGGFPVSLAVMDFRFLGGKHGLCSRRKITRAIERGLEEKAAVVVVSASGRGGMYEYFESDANGKDQCSPCPFG